MQRLVPCLFKVNKTPKKRTIGVCFDTGKSKTNPHYMATILRRARLLSVVDSRDLSGPSFFRSTVELFSEQWGIYIFRTISLVSPRLSSSSGVVFVAGAVATSGISGGKSDICPGCNTRWGETFRYYMGTVPIVQKRPTSQHPLVTTKTKPIG